VLENAGLVPARTEKDADLLIFNTCSIKQKAEDRVFGLMPKMKEIKRARRDFLVGITGCMVRKTSTKKSQDQDKLIKMMPEVDFVFRIEDAPLLPEILAEIRGKKVLSVKKISNMDANSLEKYFHINPKYSSKFQAFVPIASGCDKFCAYCIVPFARGRERSRPMAEILSECEALVKNGCKEITLLGQNVDSYGLSFMDREEKKFAELAPGEKIYFTRLLEEIDKLKSQGLVRVRWTSPHPKDLTDDLINAVATLKTQMPHIHLPMQSGSNYVLRKMNRPYTKEHYINLIKKIRSAISNCSISTDIIVGFCGETKEMFKETCDLYKEIRWDMAYSSQYSMRKNTAAHRTMKDDVPEKEKQRRWHELNKILKKCSLEHNKFFLKKTVNVLVERCSKGLCEGMSEHFKRVQFKGDKELIGQIVPVKITKALEWNLIGKL